MSLKIEVKGVKQLEAKFEAMSKAAKATGNVKVFYTAPYAVYVHENLTSHHPRGMAKFLEIPYRMFKSKMVDIVAKAIRNKEGLVVGLTRAGNLLKAESQKLVPVDTGFLRNSCQMEIERRKV